MTYQEEVDDLNECIRQRIMREQREWDERHPDAGELHRQIAHTKIEVAAWPKWMQDSAKMVST